MKRLLVLLVFCCVSGCATHRFCTGPMVPINRPAAAHARHADGAVAHGAPHRHGRSRRAGRV